MALAMVMREEPASRSRGWRSWWTGWANDLIVAERKVPFKLPDFVPDVSTWQGWAWALLPPLIEMMACPTPVPPSHTDGQQWTSIHTFHKLEGQYLPQLKNTPLLDNSPTYDLQLQTHHATTLTNNSQYSNPWKFTNQAPRRQHQACRDFRLFP